MRVFQKYDSDTPFPKIEECHLNVFVKNNRL